MKKIFSFVALILTLLINCRLAAQPFNGTITPASACVGQTVMVGITSGQSTATSYSFATGMGAFTPVSSSVIAITATNCGVQTVTCFALNGNNIVNTLVLTATIVCPGLTVSPLTQTICEGAPASLTVSGATSYTWSNGQNGSVINPTPPASTIFSVIGNQNACMASASITVKSISISANFTSACIGNSVILTASGSSPYIWTGSTLIQPIVQTVISGEAGSYTLSTPVSSGTCEKVITVAALAPMTLSTTVSTYTTCITTNFPIKISKPVVHNAASSMPCSYIWVPNNPVNPNTGPVITVRPISNSCYTVIATSNIAACNATAVSCVTVVPQFTVTARSNRAQYCRFEPVVINVIAVGASAFGDPSTYLYDWSFQSNVVIVSGLWSPTINLTSTFTSNYTVQVSDANNCISAPSTGIFYIAICDPIYGMGIKSIYLENNSFYVYPNPAKDILFVKSTQSFQNISFGLSDALGKNINTSNSAQISDTSDNYAIDLKNIRPGIYFIKIYSDTHLIHYAKVIKE